MSTLMRLSEGWLRKMQVQLIPMNTNTLEVKSKENIVTPALEEKMRVLANYIIDKMIEDQSNNTLKFKDTEYNLSKEK